MDGSRLTEFCGGDQFWDTDLTWNTTNPDFTKCFQKTALTWVPCGLLWLLSPVEIYTLCHSQSGRIPWTILNIVKTFVCSILVLLTVGELSGSIVLYANDVPVASVDFVSPAFKLATFLLILLFTVTERKRGIQSSGVQWFFWLLYVITGAVVYRSFLLNAFNLYEITDSGEFVVEAVFYPLILMQFVLACIADAPPSSFKDHYLISEQTPCPELQASFPSWLFFSWLDSMIYYGYRKDLEIKDLWALNPTDTSKAVFGKFNKYWQPEIKKAMSNYQAYYSTTDGDSVRAIRTQVSSDDDKSGVKGPNIVKVLFQSFGWLYVFGTFLKLVSDLLLFVNPMILDLLISFVGSDQPQWRGFMYAIIMLAIAIINLTAMAKSSHFCYLVAMRVRSALIATIYRKALLLSSSAKRNYTMGEVVNLMAVDVQRMMDVTVFFNLVWTAPVQFSLALYLLWQRLGVAVLAGIAVLVLLNVATTCVIGFAKRLQAQQMKLKDHRIKLMNEILNGIKVLKLYSWEQCYMDLVNGIRAQEVVVLRKAAYFSIAMSFGWMTSSVLVTLMTFTTYVLLDPNNILDANNAFVSLSLFNVMQTPIVLMPMVIMTMVQASVAIKRINKFLMSDELDPDNVLANHNVEYPLILENATFSWSVDENPVLTNINLRIRSNSLVAIVGPVGAGKSSLISAMLGELEKVSGKVYSTGSLAYVAQQAWMQNATVRENILFGKPYKSDFYNHVIGACALPPDLQILPGGDQTEIGEKGINLSGGQKQRVSLARSVYSEADLYLFDDPLSAVDVHVGKHIFDNVMGPKGMLKNSTRVLVTHRITFLPQVDLIVVVHEGTISEVGTYKELLDRKGVFAEFLVTYLNTEGDEDVTEDLKVIKEEILTKIGSAEPDTALGRSLSKIDTERHLSRQNTVESSKSALSPATTRRQQSRREEEEKEKATKTGALTVTESAETGRVDFGTYIQYMRSITFKTIIAMSLFYLTGYGCSLGSSLWLSSWSNDKPLPDGSQDIPLRNLRLGVYGTLGILFTLLSLCGGLVLTRGTTKAAERMHASLLDNVLHCPMTFFDTTPLGRIVNRFSKDVDTMDLTIPQVMQQWLGSLCQVLTTIVVISIGTPIFLAAALPIGVLYYIMQRFYVATSRQLKRLESITRSPIYSHFSESVSGAATIRAFGMKEHFVLQSDSKVDENQICYYPSIISNRWIGMRLEIIGNILVFCAALFAVLGRETLNPGIVGLTVSYALSITFLLNWVVRMTSELETNIVAVERIREYTSAPIEAPWNIQETKPPNEWPSRGEITFDRFSVRYREGLDLVLRKATCNIRSGEKVGIVGRTGAGKSSLTLSVFRLIESAGGAILIDGIDIATLGLHDLRSKLTIIPQDPVLFSGSLRMNLDPFDQHSDEDVFKVLELAHLRAFILTLSDCLMHQVAEGGENLSVGQRQLICLARALLRKSKILVLDEATAAVDLETDDLIQATIRKEFADCTVVTIAHRLNTIMDYDRIMVLDQGIIKEFDTPKKLLELKTSIFYGMAKDAGLT